MLPNILVAVWLVFTRKGYYIMTLKFLGRDSGFGNEHTSAFFYTEGKDMVVIDCPVSTFQKLRKKTLRDHQIYVFITHTHGDHIGGLGLFVQHVFFNLHQTVTIVAPSLEVASDIQTVLTIEGNETEWYKLITVNDLPASNRFALCIPTEHSPQLKGKCYGYVFTIYGKSVVYTGDTSTLKPFEPYFEHCDELYVDTSVHYGMIHLKLEDALEDFIRLTKNGTKVFLMHLDDVDAAKKIVADFNNINVVEL